MDANDRDRRDQWLDEALRQYGNVNPRAGLESRVMANLALQERSFRSRNWWAGMVSAAMACLLIVAIWLGSPRHTHRIEKIPQKPEVATSAVRELEMTRVAPAHSAKTLARFFSRESASDVTAEVVENTPRLGQFPAARPLNEQEQLLVTYVNEFPKEAGEVAQEQAERAKELEAKYPIFGSESDSQ